MELLVFRKEKTNGMSVMLCNEICLLQIFLNYSELWNSSALTVCVKLSMYCGIMFMWKLILSAADDSK